MHALNYAAHVHEKLKTLHDFAALSKYEKDANAIKRIMNALKKAVHFQIDPYVFDLGAKYDNFYNVDTPYDVFTVAFKCNICDSLVIVCRFDDGKIYMFPFWKGRNASSVWSVPILFLVSDQNYDKWLKWNCCVWTPELLKIYNSDLGDGKKHDYFNENKNALKFCKEIPLRMMSVLACSNISHSPIQNVSASLNARRIRDGKLPLYEIRTLTVQVPRTGRNARTSCGEHASPREHLRRGHIRNLESGKRIWVQSCVVNAGSENGRIDKSYIIKNSEVEAA